MNLIIINPYAGVDWSTFGQFKAGLHNHTSQSDGRHSVEEMIEHATELGFDIFSVTDHDVIFTGYDRHSGEEYDNHSMLLLTYANEHTLRLHNNHINAYFSDYDSARDPELDGHELERLQQVIARIEESGGISIINHPDRAVEAFGFERMFATYLGLFEEFDSILGVEIVNRVHCNEDETNFSVWDSLLGEFMPHRPVWGFASDDSHATNHIGISYNIMLLPELTEEAVLDSMKSGTFFAIANLEQRLGEVPRVYEIEVSDAQITIIGSGYDVIEWFANGGELLATGATLELCDELREIAGSYVRAQLRSETGLLFVQPFGLMTCCEFDELGVTIDALLACELCFVPQTYGVYQDEPIIMTLPVTTPRVTVTTTHSSPPTQDGASSDAGPAPFYALGFVAVVAAFVLLGKVVARKRKKK
jgi:predicted metal-dependent phosphoesterase TrpH